MVKNKIKKANRIRKFLLHLFHITYGPFIMRKYNVKVIKNEAKNIKGSYLLLSNHVTDHDPFFLQHLNNRPISYVITDRIFRIPVLGNILTYLYMIPKRKFSNDIKTVKEIIKAKNRGDVIGIFPEGRRNWDGNTTEILKSTSSLIKSLKMPVVTAVIKGGAASKPRWDSGKIKKGAVEIEMINTISKDEVKELSVDEIHNKIIIALSHNEAKYILEKGVKLQGRNLANGIERFLFICPSCKEFSKIEGKGNIISCTCGYEQTYTSTAQLINGKFNNIGEWNEWQKEYLKDYVKNIDVDETIFIEKDVELYAAKERDAFILLDKGSVTTSKEKIVIEGQKTHEFMFSEIKGPCVQSNYMFEFIVGNLTYRLKLSSNGNAFKYQLLAGYLINISDYIY